MEAHVLIVEDDPSLREIIRLGLEAEGFSVVTAGDGPSALSIFASDDPDLVLLDIMLPGKDGFEVCRELRKTSLVPIVMLTARASTVDIVVGARVRRRRLRHQAVRVPGTRGPHPVGVAKSLPPTDRACRHYRAAPRSRRS